MNLNNIYEKGFSLVEVLVGLMLSSGVLIGLTFLMGDIFNQLSYENVNQKVQSYGNYILDDTSNAFKEPNIDRIRIDNYDGFSIVRVDFTNSTNEIKYSVNSTSGEIDKNNEPIHLNNNNINQHFNDFENQNYSVSISEFSCNELGFAGNTERYGSRPFDGSKLRNALYIVDFQVEIYKKIRDEMELYNTIDFQRTIFVSDEFI